MTPDELLTHLEAELARCCDERDRLRAELDAVRAEFDKALLENGRLSRLLRNAQIERDWLRGEFLSVIGSKSWLLTRPLRRLLGSHRPESADLP